MPGAEGACEADDDPILKAKLVAQLVPTAIGMKHFNIYAVGIDDDAPGVNACGNQAASLHITHHKDQICGTQIQSLKALQQAQ